MWVLTLLGLLWLSPTLLRLLLRLLSPTLLGLLRRPLPPALLSLRLLWLSPGLLRLLLWLSPTLLRLLLWLLSPALWRLLLRLSPTLLLVPRLRIPRVGLLPRRGAPSRRVPRRRRGLAAAGAGHGTPSALAHESEPPEEQQQHPATDAAPALVVLIGELLADRSRGAVLDAIGRLDAGVTSVHRLAAT